MDAHAQFQWTRRSVSHTGNAFTVNDFSYFYDHIKLYTSNELKHLALKSNDIEIVKESVKLNMGIKQMKILSPPSHSSCRSLRVSANAGEWCRSINLQSPNPWRCIYKFCTIFACVVGTPARRRRQRITDHYPWYFPCVCVCAVIREIQREQLFSHTTCSMCCYVPVWFNDCTIWIFGPNPHLDLMDDFKWSAHALASRFGVFNCFSFRFLFLLCERLETGICQFNLVICSNSMYRVSWCDFWISSRLSSTSIAIRCYCCFAATMHSVYREWL